MVIKSFRKALTCPEQKKFLNQAIFSEVAPRYDRLSRLLTYGQDQSWKRKFMAAIPINTYQQVLDIGCGTGDITKALAQKFLGAHVYGLDLTPSMLELARKKNISKNIQFVEGDMCKLPWTDNSFDLITACHALRSAPHLRIALSEMNRVLKLGGTIAFLDYAKPTSKLMQATIYNSIKYCNKPFGWFFYKDSRFYNYLAESYIFFPTRKRFHQLLGHHGFDVIKKKRLFFGIVEIVVCQKKDG